MERVIRLRAAALAVVALIVLGADVAWSAPATSPEPAASQPQITPEQLAGLQTQLTGEWAFRHAQAKRLVDLARSLAGGPATPSRTVAPPLWRLDRQMVLLEAAIRIEQLCSEAAVELYLVRRDMARAYRLIGEGDMLASAKARTANQAEDAARLAADAEQASRLARAMSLSGVEALSRYVEQEPRDVAAWEWLLDERVALMQTVEQRIEFLRKELDRLNKPADKPELSPAGLDERLSAVLTRLARYVASQGRTEQARELLTQAVAKMGLNRQARAALIELAGGQAQTADYADLLLANLRLNPLDVQAAATLSSFLARLGIYHARAGGDGSPDFGAVGLAEYETNLRMNLAPRQPLPVELLARRGQFLIVDGQAKAGAELFARAFEQAAKGPTGELATVPWRVMLADLLRTELAPKELLDAEIDKLVELYMTNRERLALTGNAEVLAWYSWFYLRVRNEPAAALELARRSARLAPNDQAVRRSLGAVLATEGSQRAEAVRLLEPLAQTDPWSAWYLAQALRLDKPAEADKLLAVLASEWAGDPAGRFVRRQLGDKAPAVVGDGLVRDRLRGLPGSLLDYYKSPSKFAAVEARVVRGAEPFDPVVLEVTLTNRSAEAGGQGFDVTMGPGLMVGPDLLVSAAVQLPGDKSPRVFRDYTALRLLGQQLLAPGRQITVRQTIDVGPLRQLLDLTPQADKAIAVQVLVNPAEAENGGWTAGAGGWAVNLQFGRKGFAANDDNVREVYRFARRGNVVEKMVANDVIGSLLAEQQLADAKQIAYPARNIPHYELMNRLLESGGDADPTARAFWCESVYPVGLAGRLRSMAVSNLADTDWLVRLMAVRLVGDRIGQSQQADLVRLCQQDADQLVRRMSQTYLTMWAEKR